MFDALGDALKLFKAFLFFCGCEAVVIPSEESVKTIQSLLFSSFSHTSNVAYRIEIQFAGKARSSSRTSAIRFTFGTLFHLIRTK